MTNWAEDVKAHAPGADDSAIANIVKYCGIALRNRDAAHVSFTDKSELTTIREKFLKKKLGLTNSDAELDAAIAAVGQELKGTRNKNRVTVYYLLADHFGKLSTFAPSEEHHTPA